MEKIYRRKMENKKEKNFVNKKSLSIIFSTSIFKFNIATALKNLFFAARKFAIFIALLLMMSVVAYAGDTTVDVGNTELQNNNEIFLNLKNTETNGRQYALVSAGSAGGIGIGKFSVYDKTAGVSRLTIDANGNVGIGTTGPGSKLVVDDTGQATWKGRMSFGGTVLTLEETNAANAQYPYIQWKNNGVRGAYLGWGSASDNQFQLGLENGDSFVITGGNVGIGTTVIDNAYDKLTLYNSGSHNYLRIKAPLEFQSSIAFNDDTNGQDIVTYRPGGTRDYSIWTASAGNVLRVTQGGNVGIGTTSPRQKLDVSGNVSLANNNAFQVRNTAGTFITGFSVDSSNQMTVGSDNPSSVNSLTLNSGQPMLFRVNSAERMRINTVGNVGIGTTNPSNALDVGGSSISAVRIDGRGAFFLAAEAACLASGTGDRFLVWSAGTTQTCSQACAAITCGSAASCVYGWSVWGGTLHYRYGSECTSTDSSGGQGISGKMCCCTGTGCAQSMYR